LSKWLELFPLTTANAICWQPPAPLLTHSCGHLDSQQLDGLISGINGAAAIEAGRKNFGLARQMLDSQGIAHLLIVILIAVGTMVGWMPPAEKKAEAEVETEP